MSICNTDRDSWAVVHYLGAPNQVCGAFDSSDKEDFIILYGGGKVGGTVGWDSFTLRTESH
jgi:hypothetical protein